MAINQRLATTTTTALDFVFQASADTAVTSSDATVNIYLLPSDGSTTVPTENNKIYNALTIQGTDSYIIDTEKMILSSGDKIYVELVGSSSQIVATISTIGL